MYKNDIDLKLAYIFYKYYIFMLFTNHILTLLFKNVRPIE